MEIENICVLGNDGRMDYVAQTFYDAGYEVTRSMEKINEQAVIILPPPVKEQAVASLIPRLTSGQIVFGGAVSNRFRHECELKNIAVYDYLKWDYVTEKNAELTAKGIIKQAVCKGAVLENSYCLVTGYGFCGKAIAEALKKCNARVDVAVRRRELYDDITACNYGFAMIPELDKTDLKKYRYIFNTVPAMILSADVLKNTAPDVMLFDIASAPGGTDFSYCNEHGIYAEHSLGIPGKEYPKQAGEIIAEAVCLWLNQK